MNNLKEFIDALFASETTAQKRNRGQKNVDTSLDDDWKKLCKASGETATMFYDKYINKALTQYKGSFGQVNYQYTDVYHFAFLDKKTAQEVRSGVYVVYLLSADHKSVYLCLAVGVSDDNNEDLTREKVANIRKKISSDYFSSQPLPIDSLGESARARSYIPSMAFYKKYSVDKSYTNDELERDFKLMMRLYDSYLNAPKKEPGEVQDDLQLVKNCINQIKKYIANNGFVYSDFMIENFYLCLKSKPFVILAGTSGTGKTRLVRLFAEAIGAYRNDRYKQVAVKPDWSDSSDLFGHVNLNNEFVNGAIIEFIKKAADDPDKLPYILCLDEMNLARVEYYFSDFLSIMETRDWDNNNIVTDKLIPENCYSGDQEAKEKYSDLKFPENLYIVGTVNMDETTFPFSKKVLDRANTIEFSDVNFKLPDEISMSEDEVLILDNDFLRADYLNLRTDCADQWETVMRVNKKISDINSILEEDNAHFGYRIRDEIVFYMLNNEKYGLLPEKDAFDNQIMQKILPRIQGGSDAIAKVLCRLFTEICAGSFSSKNGQTNALKMKSYIDDKGPMDYPKSAKKICDMLKRYENDDFTSFWV